MFIIGISGGTASGKTTIVSALKNFFPETVLEVISQDSYYKKTDDLNFEEKTKLNFDHPKAIDFDLLFVQLNELKKGKTIEQPVYSFTEHNRINDTKNTTPKKILIVEGILIFNDKRLLDLFDLKIFIHADADERLIRRINRDQKERGRSIEEIMNRYKNTLKPMHQTYIEPHKNKADYVFDTTKTNNKAIAKLTNLIQQELK
ncbi:uridine kinase [Flavicella marina]|uniref:uridine kinase n=1 Tax=Flavicella marina TaxID=1475951 RepID=UPI0012653486|nr:uridine kinase [Flavicella marina]